MYVRMLIFRMQAGNRDTNGTDQKKTEVHSGNEEKTGSIVYYHPAAFYRTWCKTDID